MIRRTVTTTTITATTHVVGDGEETTYEVNGKPATREEYEQATSGCEDDKAIDAAMADTDAALDAAFKPLDRIFSDLGERMRSAFRKNKTP